MLIKELRSRIKGEGAGVWWVLLNLFFCTIKVKFLKVRQGGTMFRALTSDHKAQAQVLVVICWGK